MSITPLPALDRTAPTFKMDTDTFFGTQLPAFSAEVEAARVAIMESETVATDKAGIATTKAEEASSSATAAGLSADAAADEAVAAATKAEEALASKNAAQAAQTAINNRYRGVLAADPATRTDGTANQLGDYYVSSTSVPNLTLTFNGTTWQASGINTANLAAPSGAGVIGWIRSIGGAVASTLAQWIGWQAVTPLEFMSDAMRVDAQSGAPTMNHKVALQAAFNSGKVVIIDEVYLTSGNEVPSNSHIIFRGKGKLKLTNGADRAVLQNTNWLQSSWGGATYGIDSNITIEGMNIDGNDAFQNHNNAISGEWVTGVRFWGVTNLSITRAKVAKAKTFGIWLGAINGLIAHDIGFDQTMTGTPANQDGLHINGPAKNLDIRNIYGPTNDDLVALNADDSLYGGAPYPTGPITNALIDRVMGVGSLNGVRLLSAVSLMDQITVRNVSGSYRDVAINASPYGLGAGNFGRLTIEGVDSTGTNSYQPVGSDYYAVIALDGIIDSVIIKNLSIYKQDNNRPAVLVTTGGNIGILDLDGVNVFTAGTSPTAENVVRVNGRVFKLNFRGLNWYRDTPLAQDGNALQITGTNTVTSGVRQLTCSNWVVSRLKNVISHNGGHLDTVHLSNIIDDGGLTGLALLDLASAQAVTTNVTIRGCRTASDRLMVKVSGLSTLGAASSTTESSGAATAGAGASLVLSANQTLTGMNYQKLNLVRDGVDGRTGFDSGLHRFTAPVAGTFMFNYAMQFTGLTAADLLPVLYKNGAALMYLPGTGRYTGDAIIGGGVKFKAAIGDYYELYLFPYVGVTVLSAVTGTFASFEQIN